MQAIKEVGGEIVAALDKNDSVGVMDSYFPNAAFFTEFERFDRHLEKLKRKGEKVDYLVVCSPNYLHDAHIRFALRYGAHVICEKPVVLNPWNIDALSQLEMEYGTKIYTILQLRLHPTIIEMKKKMDAGDQTHVHEVELSYITSRGQWYFTSWKGIEEKSGGIATNIGIHFFDMLQWIFGDVVENKVHIRTHDRAAGYLQLERARIKWFLSINEDTLPPKAKEIGKRTYRSITVDGDELEFSDGFTDLHTASYQHILSGDGFGISEAGKSIEIVHAIRTNAIEKELKNIHPLAGLLPSKHPFEH